MITLSEVERVQSAKGKPTVSFGNDTPSGKGRSQYRGLSTAHRKKRDASVEMTELCREGRGGGAA